MKRFLVISLILFAVASFGQKVTLTISNGELTLGKTTTIQTYTYKGKQILFYNLDANRKVNVYFIGSSQVVSIDTTQIYSYNGVVGTVSPDTIVSHLKDISTVASGVAGSGDSTIMATKYDLDTLISNGVHGVAYSEIITMKGGGYDSTQMLPAEVTRYTEMPLGYSTGMVVDSVFLHVIGADSPSFTLDIYFGNNPTDTVNATNVTKRLIVTSNGTKRFGGAYIINGAIAWGNTVFAVLRESATPPRRVGIIIIGHRQ